MGRVGSEGCPGYSSMAPDPTQACAVVMRFIGDWLSGHLDA